MNEKQQQLTFDKGITNIPSDALCSDNCLSESADMVYMNGEHRPIQDPVVALSYPDTGDTKDATLLYVHRVGQKAMYIVRLTSKALVWGNNVGGTFQKVGEIYSTTEDGVTVKSIGKTLVVTQYDAGLGYFTWNASKNTYTQLGGDMPDIKLKFQLDDWVNAGSVVQWGEKVTNVWSSSDGDATIDSHDVGSYGDGDRRIVHEVKKQNVFNDAVVGIVWNHLKEIKKARRFCFPFWVRYAIKLYDGSYTKISEPILMYPTVKKNFGAYLTYNSSWNPTGYMAEDDVRTWMRSEFGVMYDPHCAKMKFQVEANSEEIEQWKDIIDGVDIFVSEEVIPMNLNSNWYTLDPMDPNRGSYVLADYAGEFYYSEGLPTSGAGRWTTFLFCECFSEQQFTDKLVSASQFYQVMELRLGDLKNSSLRDSSEIMTDTTLTNLTTNTRLDIDDYYTHTKVGAKTAMVYNGRLILGNLQRSIYEGGESFISFKLANTYTYDVYVTIDTADGEKVAHNRFSTREQLQYYYFYPDPRASKVEIYLIDYIGSTRIVSHSLQKHEYLNGAYFFAGLPNDVNADIIQMAQPEEYDSSPEKLPNELYVSEVNNPLVFRPAGDLVAGLGTIVGLATQTTALSQGQFGQYPLIIFASDGIYAASVGSDGVFSAIHPMSREVCNNPKSITQTDAEVFFSSSKGLMVVYGNTVKHVSEQLDGAFVKMLADNNTFVGYDYRDSLLWIANKHSVQCYIYNKKTGTIHKSNFFVPYSEGNWGGSTYDFDGFVEGVTVESGAADDTAKASDINNAILEEDAVITRLVTPAGNLPIFYSQSHDFLGVASWTATFDMSLYESGTQYYTEFSEKSRISSCAYFLANNVYYQKVVNDSVVDLVQINSNSVAEFASIYNSNQEENIVLDKMYAGQTQAFRDFSNNVPSPIAPLYIVSEEKSYDEYNKRFYYKVAFYVAEIEGGTTRNYEYSLLYTSFEGDAKYKDANNSNHPKADVTYIKSHEAYLWQNNDLESVGSIGVLGAVMASGIAEGDITTGAFDRQALQEKINDILKAEFSPIAVTRDSSEIVFNNSNRQFVNKVVYKYSWRGSDRLNTNYYSEFSGDTTIYNNSSAQNIYVVDDLFYAWAETTPGTYNLQQTTGGITSVVNDYPDTLMQLSNGSVYSLLQRPQAIDDTHTYDAVLETRPMKLENALALKSIMQIRHILQFHPYTVDGVEKKGTMTLRIFASNNLDNWIELHSLRGTPWKYYKFRYDFKDMKATDRFAGTMLITQERRSNKLR